jgi:hypothetical protein
MLSLVAPRVRPEWLQVELAGGIVAAVAGDAAVIEKRLNAGGVVVTGGSEL